MVPTSLLTWRGYMNPQLQWSAARTPALALLESVSMAFNLSQSKRSEHRLRSRLLMTLQIFYRVNLSAPEFLRVLKTSIWSSFTKLKLLEMLTNWQIMTQRRKIFCLVAPETIFFTNKSGKRRYQSHLISTKLWIWSLKMTWILFKTGGWRLESELAFLAVCQVNLSKSKQCTGPYLMVERHLRKISPKSTLL